MLHKCHLTRRKRKKREKPKVLCSILLSSWLKCKWGSYSIEKKGREKERKKDFSTCFYSFSLISSQVYHWARYQISPIELGYNGWSSLLGNACSHCSSLLITIRRWYVWHDKLQIHRCPPSPLLDDHGNENSSTTIEFSVGIERTSSNPTSNTPIKSVIFRRPTTSTETKPFQAIFKSGKHHRERERSEPCISSRRRESNILVDIVQARALVKTLNWHRTRDEIRTMEDKLSVWIPAVYWES